MKRLANIIVQVVIAILVIGFLIWWLPCWGQPTFTIFDIVFGGGC